MGSGLIIVLGAMLSPGINVAAKFGQVEYISGTSSLISGSLITVTNSYSVFESHLLGFYIALCGAFSIYIIYMERRDAV